MRGEFNRKNIPVMLLALIAFAAAPLCAQQQSKVGAPQFQRLINGNRRYVSDHSQRPAQRPTAGKQKPFAAILSCSDARVPPEILFDQGVNDLFVVRVAGNTADDPAASNRSVIDSVQLQSLDYAVESLGVRLIVVLGHEGCGAVMGAIQKCGQSSIGPMFQNICPAVTQVAHDSSIQPGDRALPAVEGNVREQINVLKQMDPFRKLVDSNELRIVGGVYYGGTGEVKFIAQ
jgi:carbonic anhydrase